MQATNTCTVLNSLAHRGVRIKSSSIISNARIIEKDISNGEKIVNVLKVVALWKQGVTKNKLFTVYEHRDVFNSYKRSWIKLTVCQVRLWTRGTWTFFLSNFFKTFFLTPPLSRTASLWHSCLYLAFPRLPCLFLIFPPCLVLNNTALSLSHFRAMFLFILRSSPCSITPLSMYY